MIVATAIMLAIPSSAQFFARPPRLGLSVVERGQLEATGYLQEHCTNGEVVLARPPLAAYLVALSPCRLPVVLRSQLNHAFVSRSELGQRRLDQNRFWDAWDRGILRTSTLERYGISYVVLAKVDDALLSYNDRYWIGQDASREEVVKTIHPSSENRDFVIYEISPVSIEHPARLNVGNVISLLGSTSSTTNARPGAIVGLTLWWQALAGMDKDYTAFIHVVGDDDRVWAQQDAMLQHGDYPTSSWEVGQTVKVEYELQLAPGAPPGEYIVKAGVYYWESGERLPVWDESGQRLPEDTLVLDHISITD